MPIVSHTLEFTTQADGSTSNVLRLYDQDAREYMVTFFAPPAFNTQAKIDLTIAEMNVQLAETEFESLIGAG
jgi:hypothetical protein